MPELEVNGKTFQVRDGATVAAALLALGVPFLRRSIKGEPRAALCGMGICFECRASVDGVPHVVTCQTLVRDGMRVTTDD